MVCDVGETEIVKSPEPRVAEAKFPVPPLVELTLPVVLILEPEVVGVTFTLMLQEPRYSKCAAAQADATAAGGCRE